MLNMNIEVGVGVLILINRLFPGGAENMAYSLCRGLAEGDDKARIITLYTNDIGYKDGVDSLRKSNKIDLLATIRLYKEVCFSPEKIIHCHLSSVLHLLPVLPLLKILKKRVVYTMHNLPEHDFPANFFLRKLFISFIKNNYLKVVSISPEVTAGYSAMVGEAPFAEIPNGVSTAEVDPVVFDVPTIICVANFKLQKRHDRLLFVFNEVLKSIPQAQLLLVGDGEERQKIEDLVDGFNIRSSVKFLGRIANPLPLIAGSDLFALASDYEGHPLCILEAMAQSRPVVAMNAGGVPSIVHNAVSGYVVNDEAEMVGRILDLLLDNNASDEMGRAGRKILLNAFSVDAMVLAYKELYEGFDL